MPTCFFLSSSLNYHPCGTRPHLELLVILFKGPKSYLPPKLRITRLTLLFLSYPYPSISHCNKREIDFFIIRMASFWFHLALIMAFMASPLLSLSSQINSKASTIAATPSFLTNPPPLSPFQELSPDILPLLPSPGGVVPPTGSSIPTIPSSPSPPNPDEFVAPGPDSAFSPLGSLPATAAAPEVVVSYFNTAVFAGLAAYWSISLLRI